MSVHAWNACILFLRFEIEFIGLFEVSLLTFMGMEFLLFISELHIWSEQVSGGTKQDCELHILLLWGWYPERGHTDLSPGGHCLSTLQGLVSKACSMERRGCF